MRQTRYVLKDDRAKFYAINHIKQLSSDKIYEVIVREHKEHRSSSQNRLYWGLWLKEIADYTGFEQDELHEMFRSEFLPAILGDEKRFSLFGKERVKRHSTTDCTTKQFTEYLNRVERFVNAEIGISLSHPEDIYYMAMGDAAKA